MKLFKKKKNELYLSDKPPLSVLGIIGLVASYIVLIFWAILVILPIFQILVSSFNANQGQYIALNNEFSFSLDHFKYLFTKTLYLKWLFNTLGIGIASAVLTVLMISFTGYAYSRYRFKGKRMSLLAIMLIQTIPAFAGITAYFTMYSIVNSITPVFTRQLMLVLIYSGGGIAGNTIVLKGYLDSISTELDDAAKLDGCS
ncbi:MAG: hypothetical protein WBO70_07150, partial [Erysipelotrichaceae bacterium]